MSSSLDNLLQTGAFKEQVRRHCEQKLAEGMPNASPRAHRRDLHPGPGLRFELHEQRRSSDGQLPQMSSSKGLPGHHKTKSGGLKPPVKDVRRSSDGQLPLMFPANDGQMFVGPPPNMKAPHHIKPVRGADQELDTKLRMGPPAMMIPKHIKQQSGSAEVQITPTEFWVEVDVAAYAPEELAVKIVGDHVVIKGKHIEGSPGDTANVTREFSRRYALPDDVVAENASVFLAKTGKLSVKVPRRMPDNAEIHTAEQNKTERKTKVKFKE